MIYTMKKSINTYYCKDDSYTSTGTYTYTIPAAGEYLITLIGGGGGTAQTDGGTDSFDDTGWAHHYGHDGGGGATFQGWANLNAGTLTITVGKAGTNQIYATDRTSGNGGDSYAVYTPTGGPAIEIARAGGGLSGCPVGSKFYAAVSGGSVTYNSTYITKVLTSEKGTTGYCKWDVEI